MYSQFSFVTQATGIERARLGVLTTPHGVVQTPNFIFCATKATLKGLSPQQIRECGTQIILSNTYHLMLQPGADTVQQMGGLQHFTQWKGPMFTDSGGFQIFSLGHGSVAQEIKGKRNTGFPKTLLRIDEEGATFRSYLTGERLVLTPERSIEIQKKLGADLIVVLDECTPFHVEKTYTESSMLRSHRWALRSLEEFKRRNDDTQALYGIVQGGVYPELRRMAADFVNEQPFFAHAVGGSLGASKEQMYEVVSMTLPLLVPDRPVHLLGIGGISDIFHGVRQGIDTFDCVHPTRLARHGGALVKGTHWSREDGVPKEHISMRHAAYRHDERPIDPTCPCTTCKTFSRAYVHHLFKAKEMLGLQALTVHNVTFMNQLMQAIRNALSQGTLDACEKEWLSPVKT